ncbi:gluconokinase [Nocardia jejuensis]|uniref:gluconokinase n=1 Tax=Nocardia jejuensis TaxID=328049 RepID=UPI000831083E|nr:gluconokinase [Nocardia jejuensis]
MSRDLANVVVVVMGVSGSGKTTVGALLAERLGVEYAEADAFHPQANIDKMASGVPLNDEDRAPWLAAIAEWIRARAGHGGVVSSSALKRRYRDVLRAAGDVRFLHLNGSREVIAARLAGRSGHFMPESLLDSQFEALEPLSDDEAGVIVDVTETPEQIVATALREL